jgi:hypothetical protein
MEASTATWNGCWANYLMPTITVSLLVGQRGFCCILILFGEDGRVQFLSEVGSELDRVNARIEHRRAWADLLKQA